MSDTSHISGGPLDEANISYALWLRREAVRFERQWPPMEASAYPPISFTWEQLERQLCALTVAPSQVSMCRELVSGVRKQAPWKPPEMVLREILCLAGVLMDESFRPEPGSESGPEPGPEPGEDEMT